MEVVQLIGFNLFGLSVLYSCGINWRTIIILTFFLPCLPFIHGLLSFSLITFIIFLFITSKYNYKCFNYKGISAYCFIIFIFSLLVLLSVNNGASIFVNIAKLVQLSVLIFCIIFYRKMLKYSISELLKINVYFIAINIIFGLIIHYAFSGYDIGLLRFSGIFFDSNYFAFYLFLFYVLNDVTNLNKSGLIFLNLLFILITLSLTVITLLFFYILLKKIFSYFNNKTLLIFVYFLIFSFIVTFFMLLPLINNIALDHSYDNKFIIYKLVSLTKRFGVQLLSYELLGKSWDYLLWGFGSGRNYELTKIALHSFYLQSLFSHGIIYFFILLIFLFYQSLLCLKVYFNSNKFYNVQSFFVCFFICLGFLDPFFNGFLLLFLFFITAIPRNYFLHLK